MATRKRAGWWWLIFGAAVLALAVASLLPLVEGNTWWIRFLDFPRVQIAIALIAALILYAAVARGAGRFLVIAVGLAALGYHAYKLYPYAPFMPEMAVAAPMCEPEARLRVMISNVQRGNRQADDVLAAVAAADPDLLLLMETDEWWDEALGPLGASYPHAVQHIPQEATYYGMHLFSKRPLIEPRFTFDFGPETPAVATGVEMPSGEAVAFHGIHPRPPLYWSQPSTTRDATILSAALDAAASDRPAIVAGDFNAVPWERVTRRAMRLGGLLDPRVGRGLRPTYDAQSALKSWPLDQILYQPAFTLLDVERLGEVGSDHYPYVATLCHDPDAAALQAPPAPHADDLEEARTSLEAAGAPAP